MMFCKRSVTLLVLTVVLASLVADANAQRRRRPEPRLLTDEERQQAVVDLDRLLKQTADNPAAASTDVEAAVSILSRAARALPPEVLLEKLAGLRKNVGAGIPAADKPLKREDSLERQILTLELNAIEGLSPDRVAAHPCADAFPGPVPADAERVTGCVEIITDRPGWSNTGIYANAESPYWHSTGLYAAPGEVISVEVPDSASREGLSVRIGCHSDRLWRLDSWRRAPEICVRRPIDSVRTEVASAFGGLIYIETPRDLSVPAFRVTITNAVPAPYYVLGKTDSATWNDSVRRLPAPWAELQTDKVILTLPSDAVRHLDDPRALMEFWDGIMDRYTELLGLPPERRRIERFVSDLQISAGYMHSGYPLMTMLDITTTMVDKQRIAENRHHGVWGLFHEIGHNHQNRDWTFEGTTEVTVNLFSLYVMEKVCGLTTGGHPAVTEQARQRAIKRYFEGGRDFQQWKSDPFLALAMYIQLQQAFGWKPFTKVFAEYRGLSDQERPRTDNEKRDQWLTRFSRAVGRDLGPFFQAWGVPTSDEARAAIADLPDWMPEDLPVVPQGSEQAQ